MKKKGNAVPSVPIDEMTIGQLIKASRVTAEISQDTLAKGIDVPKTTISYWENDGSVPKASMISKIVTFIIENGGTLDNSYLERLNHFAIQARIEYGSSNTVNNSSNEIGNILVSIIRILPEERRNALYKAAIAEFNSELESLQQWLANYITLSVDEQNKLLDEFQKKSQLLVAYNKMAINIKQEG